MPGAGNPAGVSSPGREHQHNAPRRAALTVILTGFDLEPAQVVRVARDGAHVAVDPGAIDRMISSRAVVERAQERGDRVYGISTGVGAGIGSGVSGAGASRAAVQLIGAHRVASGPELAKEVVRATTLILVNGFASGVPGVRPELAVRYVDALNADDLPAVKGLGSVGEADLAPLADLADGVLAGFELGPGEGLAVLSSNAVSTATATLALWDAGHLLDSFDAAGALSLEAFGANLSMLHPAVGSTRPFAGIAASLERMRALLAGSGLWTEGAPRNLQDPLTFRSLPQVNGAARDAFGFAEGQVRTELNSSGGNPIVVLDEDRLVSVANFESLPIAAALDFVRIGLAPVVSGSSERTIKLLDASWSGLPRGLIPGDRDGLSFLGISVQALAAEARLLAAPVSFELVSTSHAEGIEDRTSLAHLSSRRLQEMVALATGVAATELIVGAQAVEVRGSSPIGEGVANLLAKIRRRCPSAKPTDPYPPRIEPVTELIGSGALSASP